jgi:predicted methyltransferase
MNTANPSRRPVLTALAGFTGLAGLTALGSLPVLSACSALALPMAEDEALRAALDLPHRSAANRARDVYRHPYETLRFFGLRPTSSVVELSPGGGWYTEILAPYLRASGRFCTAHFPSDSPKDGQRRARAGFDARLAGQPEVYDRVFSGSLPRAGRFSDIAEATRAEGGVDLILTFRNVHNWLQDGTLDDTLKACQALLKPGGGLGVVDHRADPGTTLATMAKTGYVTEAWMEERARAAGLRLAARSEVNANLRDTKDHPDGVWSLPPTYQGKDVGREVFAAIGESDRYTHRYAKA